MSKEELKKMKKKGDEYGKDMCSLYLGGFILALVIIIIFLIYQFT